MDDLPNRIRELRLERKFSLDKLAELVGCSKVQIYDLELGKRRLSTVWMSRIAPVLGVSEAELLRDDQNPFRLSARELRLIEAYRAANETERTMIDRVADATRPERPAEEVDAA